MGCRSGMPDRSPSRDTKAREARVSRVGQVSPLDLGVRPAIRNPAGGGVLPTYVDRDIDEQVRAGARDGTFVLLVGACASGKSRTAYEAARAVLSDRPLLHPASADEIPALADTADGQALLWLDRLDRFLAPDGDRNDLASTIRSLIGAGTVIIGTLTTREYIRRTAPVSSGVPDRWTDARAVVDQAGIIIVSSDLSVAERRRARAVAGTDPRVRQGLDTPGFGVIQCLAGTADLIRRWEAPRGPAPGRALITAASDARRVGAHSPLSRPLLSACTAAYLGAAERADLSAGWFEDALAYATALVQGAAAALVPTGDGFLVADDVHEYASSTRRTSALPDGAWKALVAHHHDDDTVRLADSAAHRGRYGDAEVLYRQAADSGDEYAAGQLATLLAKQGRVADLRERADTGDWLAAARLATVLTENGDIAAAIAVMRASSVQATSALRSRADAGDRQAAARLAAALQEQREMTELRARADAGDAYALDRLIEVYVAGDQSDEAMAALRACLNAGGWNYTVESAMSKLFRFHLGRGQVEQVLAFLRPYADVDQRWAGERLASLLAENGYEEELRDRADTGDPHAGAHVANLLAAHGRLDELRARADRGEPFAVYALASQLTAQGQLDEVLALLRPRAETGDAIAAGSLADVLVEHQPGDAVAVLRPLAHRHWDVAEKLVGLLRAQGDVEEATALLRAHADHGGEQAVERLVTLLVDNGRADEAHAMLDERARAGDWNSTRRLVDLLLDDGHVEAAITAVRSSADAGDPEAAQQLVALQVAHGQRDEAVGWLRERSDAGDTHAAEVLVDLLAGRRRTRDLKQEAAAGTRGALDRLQLLS